MAHEPDEIVLAVADGDRFADLVLALHAQAHLLVHRASDVADAEQLLGLLSEIRVNAVEMELAMVELINGSGAATVTDVEVAKRWRKLDAALARGVSSATRRDRLIARFASAVRGTHARLPNEALRSAILAFLAAAHATDRAHSSNSLN